MSNLDKWLPVANLTNSNQPNIRTTSICFLIKIGKQVKHSKALSHSVAVPDPDPLVRGTDPDQAPDPSITQK